jgi:thymidylate kinase
MEQQGLEYLERVRQGFLEEARRRSEIVVVDAARDVAGVQADLRAAASSVLQE